MIFFERFSLKFFGVIILLYCLPPWIRIWIRIHMDIFGILDPDPDPHENLCGSETLLCRPLLALNEKNEKICVNYCIIEQYFLLAF